MSIASIPTVRVTVKPTSISDINVVAGAVTNQNYKYLMGNGVLFITNDSKFIKLKY